MENSQPTALVPGVTVTFVYRHCQKCNHEWMSLPKPPRRCPKDGCRSV